LSRRELSVASLLQNASFEFNDYPTQTEETNATFGPYINTLRHQRSQAMRCY